MTSLRALLIFRRVNLSLRGGNDPAVEVADVKIRTRKCPGRCRRRRRRSGRSEKEIEEKVNFFQLLFQCIRFPSYLFKINKMSYRRLRRLFIKTFNSECIKQRHWLNIELCLRGHLNSIFVIFLE